LSYLPDRARIVGLGRMQGKGWSVAPREPGGPLSML